MSLYIIIYIATHTYTVVRSEFIVCNTRLCTSLRGLYKYVQAMHFGGQARAVQFSPVHTSLTLRDTCKCHKWNTHGYSFSSAEKGCHVIHVNTIQSVRMGCSHWLEGCSVRRREAENGNGTNLLPQVTPFTSNSVLYYCNWTNATH